MKALLLLIIALAASATPIAEPEAHADDSPDTDPVPQPDKETDPKLIDPTVHQIESRSVTVRTTDTLNCRTRAGTSHPVARQFRPGRRLTAVCQTFATNIHGLRVWLKIDPGPTIPYCYVSAYYTNYMDPSVPFAGYC